MSASALPGSRVEWYLAGMTAIAETETVSRLGPGLETGGTTNLTTTAQHADAERWYYWAAIPS
jgi:hypothetical protein